MPDSFSESWFFAPGLAAPGDRVLLPDEEAHHLRKVLRIPRGASVIAGDGKGKTFSCTVQDAGNGALSLEAVALLARAAAPPRLHMVLALLKGRDLEEPVEALAQLEIRAIHLVITEHCQVFKGQDHSRLLERLRAKSLAGLKQAKKSWLTEITGPLPLRAWREAHTEPALVVAAPGRDRGLPPPGAEYALAIGPEGGFSSAEMEWFEAQGCGRLSLGPTRIRGMHAPLLAAGKLMGLGLA